MPYLTPRYAPELVAASLLIAVFASYVALDLSKRVRATDRSVARSWWVAGSLAMGTGIWAMHFIGMFAYSLPIQLGYRVPQTLLSWVAGVAASAVALNLASRGRLSLARLAGGALMMGAGICAMHYIGMAALDMAPPIVWDAALVARSALIAALASAAALLIFFWLSQLGENRSALRYQIAAAWVMGLAISGMHYTGMAAASFPAGSICLSAGELSGPRLGALVMMASLGLLGLTLLTSTLDARLQSQAVRLSASLQDANAQLQSANEELRRRAFLDPLTDLPNRLLFEDRLRHALARSERPETRRSAGGDRHSERIAVLCIDLDGFKPVNDSLGHAAGDTVLREVARRLLLVARDSDTVARVGGDEFLLLMEDVPDIADCAALARRLLQSLAEGLIVAEQPLHIAASIGIAVHPDHGSGDKLLAQADAAMYAAKRAGGSTYALFEPHMDAKALEQLSLQSELRQALAEGQLSLHYQPKFDSRRARIRGVEALLRWQHPQRGAIAPSVFIPIAERFGLINELGNWVIDEACRQMHEWQQSGLRMRVAINLSVHQLRQNEDLLGRIEAALRRHAIAADRLLCEITESVAMEDIRTTQRAFDGLGRLGVFLSIDDFGTGYSSLSYLRQLPARQLKIDRSFIQDLAVSADARAVVDAVIRLAHALSLSVVAEGVETPAQRDILLELGCDELQGYLFAEPMPAAALLDWAAGRGKPDGAADFSPSVFAARP
jgi:diguanylate cyclase (GGDEF)-like protein